MTDEPRALNVAVGATLRRSLREAGFSVRVAAELAGLSYRSVRRYVTGERDLPVPVLLALLHATGADLVLLAQRLQHELQGGTESPLEAQQSSSAQAVKAASDEAENEDVDDSSDPLLQLEVRLRQLGVTRLAARSVRPIDSVEQSAVLDIVEQIVLGLREDHATEAASADHS